MSSVDFTGSLWLNLAADPSQKWRFTYVTGIQSNPALNVTTDTDALGNQGAIITPGNALTIPVTLVACDAPRRWALETYLPGKPIWYRDDRRRKTGVIYGSSTFPVQITEHPYNDECDIAVTFTVINLVEGP